MPFGGVKGHAEPLSALALRGLHTVRLRPLLGLGQSPNKKEEKKNVGRKKQETVGLEQVYGRR